MSPGWVGVPTFCRCNLTSPQSWNSQKATTIMGKSIALAGLLVLLLVLLVFQYMITSVPGLEPPIVVRDARLVDDDNSLMVSLIGRDGRRFTVGLRGDMTEKPEEAALFFISRPDLVPYVYWPGYRSNDEKRVLRLLGAWAKTQDAPAPGELTAAIESGLPAQGAAHATAYQIYTVLKDRN